MAAPVITPLLQWCDANGDPMAGGTIETYLPGTSTPKACWIDPDQTALATNPVVMDSAGRTLMWGDGEYRLVIRTAVGDLVADIEATTIVSAAMAPVVAAPTIADALNQLGVADLIAAEATARSAADSAEQTARIAADTAETTAREDADADLQTALDAEIARATAREDDLEDQITAGGATVFRSGTGITDGAGNGTVTFSSAFPTACDSLQLTLFANALNCTIRCTSVTTTGCVAFVEDTNNTGGIGSVSFFYFAAGH